MTDRNNAEQPDFVVLNEYARGATKGFHRYHRCGLSETLRLGRNRMSSPRSKALREWLNTDFPLSTGCDSMGGRIEVVRKMGEPKSRGVCQLSVPLPR